VDESDLVVDEAPEMGRLRAYGASDKKVEEVKSGELTTYCPACPQPGINLPTDWTEDAARHKLNFSDQACLILSNRWVYKHIFVADGNFKADHVRQKKLAGDVWLSEGSGMIAKAEEYTEFLKYATEKRMVSDTLHSRRCQGQLAFLVYRTLLVKTTSGPS
jgi:hypothetical protein